MTDLPEPARQMAADLANAEEGVSKGAWTAADFKWDRPNHPLIKALARLCARTIERDALLARMEVDMAEIDRLLGSEISPAHDSAFNQAATIAARWRVEADPLLIEARKLVAAEHRSGTHDLCFDGVVKKHGAAEAEIMAGKADYLAWPYLVALRRGLELGRTT